MKHTDETYIKVGKIGSTFGIKGWLKIHTYTEFGASILEYQPWHLARETDVAKDQWQSIQIEDGKVQGNTVIVKFPEYNNPEDARALTGMIIAVRRSQLPTLAKNEYYWSDLVGLTAINKDGSVIGKVAYLIETGSNDVLVVKGEKEHAIPYLPGKVVTSIDLEKQEIHVDWDLI